ncbi:CAP domain-containing protein [Aeromicrobium sp.]|uniref:CAP domain-containing protein n=1 Tax=Aeromicrobium sp. TaxID=1871063 RepID=UPI0019894830|nr:CAP domain-containing protein [Aeromicrobium sp.]MBC7630603.1 CAP domain-containing protein [Aeromicrobium sp.]
MARLVAVAILAVAFAPSPAPAATVTSSTYESQVVSRTNAIRSAHNLATLRTKQCVDNYAESWSRWMARHKRLVHQSLSKVLDACDLTGVAENIAVGFTSGNSVLKAWMASPGHRTNILRSKMRYIGVGATQDSNGRWWVSQVFGTRR